MDKIPIHLNNPFTGVLEIVVLSVVPVSETLGPKNPLDDDLTSNMADASGVIELDAIPTCACRLEAVASKKARIITLLTESSLF